MILCEYVQEKDELFTIYIFNSLATISILYLHILPIHQQVLLHPETFTSCITL